MGDNLRAAVVQAKWLGNQAEMLDRQETLARQAAEQGAEVLCFQELFNAPYFCHEQDAKFFGFAEAIPDGPTMARMQRLARETGMVLVVPIYERDGVNYFNSAAVIEADGTYLGKYRKLHIPHANGFWEKYYFRPGDLGCPVFETSVGRIGVYICYDRHFPEGARLLGLQAADLVFIPTATADRTRALWEVESRGHAIANGYYVASVNRVGQEQGDWRFFGSSYFCGPNGDVLTQAGDTDDEVLVADLDLNRVHEAGTFKTRFFRDRRPDAYSAIMGS